MTVFGGGGVCVGVCVCVCVCVCVSVPADLLRVIKEEQLRVLLSGGSLHPLPIIYPSGLYIFLSQA